MPSTISELRNPPEEFLRRRQIVALTRFNNDDIVSGDHETWGAAEAWYAGYTENRRIERLMRSIESEGLRTKIEIRWDGPGTPLMLTNGHHRVMALRRLGWTHVPYRWYIPQFGPGAYTYMSYRRGRLPEKIAA